MSVELLKKELYDLSSGRIGDFFKFGMPDIDNITDFSEYQLYNENDVVCIYNKPSGEFKFYRCIENNTTGDIDNKKWELHRVYIGNVGGSGNVGGVIDKTILTVITDSNNTRRIEIPVLDFDPTINKIDVFVDGKLYSPHKYTIIGKTITINNDQIGLSANREITINMYTIV